MSKSGRAAYRAEFEPVNLTPEERAFVNQKPLTTDDTWATYHPPLTWREFVTVQGGKDKLPGLVVRIREGGVEGEHMIGTVNADRGQCNCCEAFVEHLTVVLAWKRVYRPDPR